MDKSLVCERCGGPKPAGLGAEDLCPRCVLGLGLEADGDTSEDLTVAASGSEGTASSRNPTRIGHYRIIRLIGLCRGRGRITGLPLTGQPQGLYRAYRPR